MSGKKDNQCKCFFSTFDPHRKEKCKLFGKKGVLINPNSDAEQKAMAHSSQGINMANEQEDVQNPSATVENAFPDEQQIASSPISLTTSSLGSEDHPDMSPPTIEIPHFNYNAPSPSAALESDSSLIPATSPIYDPANPLVAPPPPLSPTSPEDLEDLMSGLDR